MTPHDGVTGGNGMSRLFNMLSGAVAIRAESASPAAARPTTTAVTAVRSDDDVDGGFADGIIDAPFIEVGGPSGPVFSGSVAAVKAPPKPAAAAETKPAPSTIEPTPEAREFPRLAETQRYVSVIFHNLGEAKRPAVSIDGPDLGLVALHVPDHPVSGEYRSLRDAIRVQIPQTIPRVIQFAAAASEAGTSSVLLNLAVTLARQDSPRVLVVDANLDRPALARLLGVKSTPGLAEVLVKQIPLPWAVQPTVVPHLEVLAIGAIAGTTAEAFTEDFPRLIEQLRQWYDWVLIDAGVWGTVPERDGACAAADAVYLVTRDSDATRPEFAALRTGVKHAGGLLRGYISTRV